MAEDGSTMEPSGRRSTHALEQRLHPPYAAEQIAAEVICSHELPTPLVWIEHWSKESTGRGEETFELVVLSSYEVEEQLSKVEWPLWSQEVDDGLYTDSHQGDED